MADSQTLVDVILLSVREVISSSSKKSDNGEAHACPDPSRDRLDDDGIETFAIFTISFSSALVSFRRPPMASSVVATAIV